MEVNHHIIAAMRAVTISREYGSGGGEIAARLARRLGWRLFDHQVVAQAAQEMETHRAVVQAYDEKVQGALSRILGWPYPTSPAETQAYYEALRHVVEDAADAGHVVIVGRGGQVLLADQRDVLHVRVVAPLEQRCAYVAQREVLDMDAARKRAQEKDRTRTRYMRTQFHCQHDDPHLYDLVINTAVLALDGVVDQICLALEQKASQRSLPIAALGPATGLQRYPGQVAEGVVVPSEPSS